MINIKSNFLKDLFFGHYDGFKTRSKSLRVILILLSPIRIFIGVLCVIFVAIWLCTFGGLMFAFGAFVEGGFKLEIISWSIILFDLLLLILYIKARISDD